MVGYWIKWGGGEFFLVVLVGLKIIICSIFWGWEYFVKFKCLGGSYLCWFIVEGIVRFLWCGDYWSWVGWFSCSSVWGVRRVKDFVDWEKSFRWLGWDKF